MKIITIENNLRISEKIKNKFVDNCNIFNFANNTINEEIESIYPDLVLIASYSFNENDIQTLLKIKNLFPDIPVLITSSGGMTDYVMVALKVGAIGFCSYDNFETKGIELIEDIFKGEAEIPVQLAQHLINQSGVDFSKDNSELKQIFTAREMIILKLITKKLPYEYISESMNLPIDRLKHILRNLYRKIHNYFTNQVYSF